MLNQNYSYRIYPDAEQEKELLDWLEICRKVYNYALAERKDWINSRKCAVNSCSLRSEYIISADTPFPDYYKQKKALTLAKKDFPELKRVYSQVLQEVIGRLDKAFNRFWKDNYGFPRFKKYGQFRSICFPQFTENPVTLWQIKLPKIGNIRINLHRPIPNNFAVKQVQIVKKASGWYAILNIQLDVAVPEPVAQGKSMGIDIGLETFIATSDGELIARPRFLGKLQSKIKWLQRRLSKTEKGSKNRAKIIQKLARVHERIHDSRKDFHYKTAHHLCDQAQVIIAEDLSAKGLSRGMLRKCFLDISVGSFLNILEHTCWKRGAYFKKVDKNYTSQICPQCQTLTGKKDLTERVHSCSNCGFTTNRDTAAAQVILQRGMSALGHRVKLSGEEEVIGGEGQPTPRASRRTRKSSERSGEARTH